MQAEIPGPFGCFFLQFRPSDPLRNSKAVSLEQVLNLKIGEAFGFGFCTKSNSSTGWNDFRLGGIVRFRDSLACSDVVDVGRFRTKDGMDAETRSDDPRMRAGKKVSAGKSRRSIEKQFRVAASTVIERFQRYSDKEKSRVAGDTKALVSPRQ